MKGDVNLTCDESGYRSYSEKKTDNGKRRLEVSPGRGGVGKNGRNFKFDRPT